LEPSQRISNPLKYASPRNATGRPAILLHWLFSIQSQPAPSPQPTKCTAQIYFVASNADAMIAIARSSEPMIKRIEDRLDIGLDLVRFEVINQ